MCQQQHQLTARILVDFRALAFLPTVTTEAKIAEKAIADYYS